jgi:hypothetical protein
MMLIVITVYQGETTMKLNLLFTAMYMLTLLAYPIVFMHGKLRQLSKSRDSINPASSLVTVSISSGR